MIKLYLIHSDLCVGGKRNFDQQVEEIKQINPDRIICNSQHEFDADKIFYEFFEKINPWLKEHNKMVHVLGSNANGEYWYPNVVTEKTCGYHLPVFNALEYIQYTVGTQIDLNNIHLLRNNKLFTCYNKMLKFHRALMIDTLARDDLLKDGFFTVCQPNEFVWTFEKRKEHPELCTGTYPWKYYNGNKITDEEDYAPAAYLSGLPPKSATTGFFDIVTESSYQPNVYLMSEKTGRSVSLLKPFLVLSSQGYHDYLVNEFGFELYTELFDYSFDNLPSIKDRVEGIVDNIKRLRYLMESPNEVNKLHDILLPKMIHNRNRLNAYTFIKEKMIPKSFWFMTETTDYELYGDVARHHETNFNFYKRMDWLAK